MGESKRRKLIDPNYGKKAKSKSNLDELKAQFIKYSSIASFLQYFIEIAVNVPDGVKPHQPYVLKSLNARANELKGFNPSSIKEILDTHGHDDECQSTFLVLGLSAICEGLFSYINELQKNFPSIESVIKSFDKSEVEKVAANTEKYQEEQGLWLDAFSNM